MRMLFALQNSVFLRDRFRDQFNRLKSLSKVNHLFINSNHDALNIGKKMLNLYFMCNLYTIILKPDKKLEQNKPQFNVLSMQFLKTINTFYKKVNQ